MKFADGYSILLSTHTPPITSQNPTGLNGWKSQIVISTNNIIFSIYNGEYWENHLIFLQVKKQPEPIILFGVLTTNIHDHFVFYVTEAQGFTGSIFKWLTTNYSYNRLLNPFIIRQVPFLSSV